MAIHRGLLSHATETQADRGGTDEGEPPTTSSLIPCPPIPIRPTLRLDRLGLSQCIAGLLLGLIALFSSYDHISIAGYRIPLQQPWGIVCIAASLAAVVVVAVGFCEAVSELATRSRLRAARDAAHAADAAAGRPSRSSSRARSSRSGARQSRSGATAIGSGKKSSSDGARTPGSRRGTPKAEPCCAPSISCAFRPRAARPQQRQPPAIAGLPRPDRSAIRSGR